MLYLKILLCCQIFHAREKDSYSLIYSATKIIKIPLRMYLLTYTRCTLFMTFLKNVTVLKTNKTTRVDS